MEKFIIKCANCGKEFEPSDQVRNRIKREPDKPRFCTPKCRAEHTGNKRKVVEKYKCDLCGKEFELSQDQRLTKKDNPDKKFFCSRQCSGKYNMSSDNIKIRNEHSAQTKLKRYGSSTYNNRDKAKETVRELYGTDNIFQVKDIKEKSKQTKLNRYGDENYNNKEQISKSLLSMDTNKRNKWVESRAKSQSNTIQNRTEKEWDIIKQKLSKSNEEAWNNMTEERKLEIREIMSKHQKERWGSMTLEQKTSLYDKCRKTIQDKYGVDYACMTKQCREASTLTVSKLNMKWEDILKMRVSSNIKIEHEKAINHFSYDLCIDDHLLIDINPTISHNSTYGFMYATGRSDTNNPIGNDYHYKRTMNALNNGYELISIFDWMEVDKVIDIIKARLKKLNNRIFGNKCIVKEIPQKDANIFLNQYHLQGGTNGQEVCIGLFFNNELVQVQTFGKPRFNKDVEWEAIRLASKADTYIIGGVSKGFKYFVDKYNPTNIISYNSLNISSGHTDDMQGFKLQGYSKSQGIWVNTLNNNNPYTVRDMSLRKQGIDRILNRPAEDFPDYDGTFETSNEYLMILEGYVKVYDCGNVTYIWNK